MITAGAFRHGLSCSRLLCRVQAEIPLITPVQISRSSSFNDMSSPIYSSMVVPSSMLGTGPNAMIPFFPLVGEQAPWLRLGNVRSVAK
ncbi:hypothetical protein EN759_39205 [Mesorhizobium sp. M00.F.Ca.ET.038.03.1.1]|nr:hypothetical protein EN759_39205 [Mesorhizobium sp. M00.F.Ca.ET.038.03.1.1]